jgi:hypothetical protein
MEEWRSQEIEEKYGIKIKVLTLHRIIKNGIL